MLSRTIEGNIIRYTCGAETVLLMEEKITDVSVLVSVCGELRSELAWDLQDELTAFAVCGMEIRLDLGKVNYISNGVQTALVRVQQCIESGEKGSMVLTGLSPQVREALESTGMIDCLEILE